MEVRDKEHKILKDIQKYTLCYIYLINDLHYIIAMHCVYIDIVIQLMNKFLKAFEVMNIPIVYIVSTAIPGRLKLLGPPSTWTLVKEVGAVTSLVLVGCLI